MPLDSLTISALGAELAPILVGGKIDKVQQPARDMLILSVRGHVGNVRVCVSGGVGSARVNITTESFDNPQSPPMFCMLMRKHIVGARISAFYQPDFERMLIFELDAFDEMGFPEKKRLVVEMLGRGTNIILVSGDGHIVDCLRRVDAEMNPVRQVLPGLIYHMPPKQNKPDFFTICAKERFQLLKSAPRDKAADRFITETFSGVSPLLAREMCSRAVGDPTPVLGQLSGEQQLALTDVFDSFCDCAAAEEFTPCMVMLDGRPKEFSCFMISQFGSAAELAVYPGFSELLDAFYTKRDKADDIRRRSQSLYKSVKNAHDRVKRKLEIQREDLKKTRSREEKRKYGELITANIYRLKKGMSEFETEDYYDEACPLIRIPLNPLKSPQQNAAIYYKEYNKAKSAQMHLSELIVSAERDLDYLRSVLDELERAENDLDIAEIRRELTDTGYIKKQKGSGKEKIREQKPMSFLSSSGFEILVGRNNAQNDRLTTKIARKTDIWFHTQKIHGSHVILRTEGENPDASSIAEAAGIAAYYSQGRGSGKVAVDYTQVRYVKKPSGSLPGKVVYTDYNTMMVRPDECLIEKLKTCR